LRLLQAQPELNYILVKGTLSLPFVGRPEESLFYEHVKRLCCVEARAHNIGLFTLSKSSGFPALESVEEIARAKLSSEKGKVAEHWYLRVPIRELDGWQLPFAKAARLPPPGAITYLVRFHHTIPVLRLDIDRDFWFERIRGSSEAETRANEHRIFEHLDYASHDQRYYGYPYPLKAAHDRILRTQAMRLALRKRIIDAAARSGLKRSLFTEVTQLSE
jgi:hypothetical protein